MRNLYLSTYSSLFLSLFLGVPLAAGAPVVGRKAAAKYLESPAREMPSKSGDSLLMLNMGTYQDSTSWLWKGSEKRSGIGTGTYGLTYFIDEYGQSMDFNLRIDFNEYKLDEVHPFKMSLLPMLTFPKFETRFPIYFGVGAGLGVFFRQVEEESNLSFDYQMVVGIRFLDLINSSGFFVEYGMRNHVQLLSDGQFNGNAISAGAAFVF